MCGLVCVFLTLVQIGASGKTQCFQGYISDISTYIYNGLTGIYTNVMHVYATDKNMH